MHKSIKYFVIIWVCMVVYLYLGVSTVLGQCGCGCCGEPWKSGNCTTYCDHESWGPLPGECLSGVYDEGVCVGEWGSPGDGCICTGGGGGGGGGCTPQQYDLSLPSDAITANNCTLSIIASGWDDSDNQPVGWLTLEDNVENRRVGMNDSGATSKCGSNLDFRNSWVVNGRNISIGTEIISKNAGNNLTAGYSMSISGDKCFIWDGSSCVTSETQRMVTNSGSRLVNREIVACGDGVCSCNENSTCPQDCRPAVPIEGHVRESITNTGIVGARVDIGREGTGDPPPIVSSISCGYDGHGCTNSDYCCGRYCNTTIGKCAPYPAATTTIWNTAENFYASYISTNNTFLPDGTLKFSVLGIDSKTVTATYYKDTVYQKTVVEKLSETENYRSFDEVTLPDNRIKQTLLSADGTTLKYRYISNWTPTSATVGNWTNDAPFGNAYRSFGHVVVSPTRIRQTLLGDDGKSWKVRYIENWGTNPLPTSWTAEVPFQNVHRSFDEVKLPDNRIKQTLLSEDGKYLKVRYISESAPVVTPAPILTPVPKPKNCGTSLLGTWTTGVDGFFTTGGTKVKYGKEFCITGNALVGYENPTFVDCQIADSKFYPDGCDDSYGTNLDKEFDQSFVIEYTPKPPELLSNFFVLRNATGGLVGPDPYMANTNQNCQNTFRDAGSTRKVKFEITATNWRGWDKIKEIKFKLNDGTNDIAVVTWNADEAIGTYVNGDWQVPDGVEVTNVNSTQRSVTFPMMLGNSLNSSTIYHMQAKVKDEFGQETVWKDTGRDFKIWDCNVPLSGKMYDSSNVAIPSCGDIYTFGTPINEDIDFDKVFVVPGNEIGTDGLNSYAYNSLTWGNSYRIEPDRSTLKAMVTNTKWTGTGGTLIGCGAQYPLDNPMVNPYNDSPVLRVDFAAIKNQDPWFQVVGGGIQSKDVVEASIPVTCAVDVTIPSCQAALSIKSRDGLKDNSLVAGKNGVNNAPGCVFNGGFCLVGKPNNWWIVRDIVGKSYNYQYFYNNYYANKGEGYVINTDTSMSSIFANIEIGGTGVIFVKGNLDIDTDNTVAKDDFLMIVVSGQINIGVGASKVEGIFIADMGIGATGTSDNKLQIEGMLMSGNSSSIRLSRGYDITTDKNNKTPGTLITYRPDFLFNMPPKLSKILTNWKEGR